MMTRHALAVLILGGIVFAAMTRACARPAASAGAPLYVPWVGAQGRCDYRRDWYDCMMRTETARALATPTPTRASATWEPQPRGATVRLFRTVGVWRWDEVAVVARLSTTADKPTASPTDTRTPTPSTTRPARATRTARPTGTATQGRMATVPACGCDTPEPGPETPFPGCWPPMGPCSPTPTPTDTPTPTPRDTPPATATWEPTPTAMMQARPAAARLIPVEYRYLFPLLLNRRGATIRGATP